MENTTLLKSLLSAKKEMGKVAKNAKNPHFKNTYADINALIDAVEPILLDNGLLLTQPLNDGKVSTIITHAETGEQMMSEIYLPTSGTPQQMGSAITYYRRYTLQSLLSLQAEDDDANTASKVQAPAPKKQPLENERFAKGIEKINAGELTMEQFENNLKKFNLTKEQVETLKALKAK